MKKLGSKKHHYVPQVMLRQFGFGKNQIMVFDKYRSKHFPSSIIDAGAENHFNTIQVNGERLNFESIFQKYDDDFAEIQDKLLNNGGTNKLGLSHRARLLEILAVQMSRTKLYRSNFASIAKQLKKRMPEICAGELDVATLSDNDTRKIALSSLGDISELVSAIDGKVGFLIQANESKQFIISDNPLVFHNTFPYGHLGLSSPGIEIYLPLSTDITLALYCPSIIRKLELAVHPASEIDSKQKSIYQGIIYGLKIGEPVSLGESTTEFLNSLQVSQSTRFLYGNAPSDFDLAKKILLKHTDLSHVDTKISLGKLGEVPRSSKMPDGEWVVFHTPEDHCMLHVYDVSTGNDFSFKTELNDVVEYLLSSEIIEEVSLFRDGCESRHMKEVEVVCNKLTENIVFITFKHRLEFLNRIIEDAGT
jgi:hypothetical protein